MAQEIAPDQPGGDEADEPILPPVPATVPPDADALLAALAARLGPGDLAAIAEADHGWQAEAHRQALDAILREGRVPRPLGWQPHEVLALTQWDTPPDEHTPEVRARHRRRAFACAVLLRAGGDAETYPLILSQNATVAGLIDSLQALAAWPGQPAAGLDGLAAAFMAWLTPVMAEREDAEGAFHAMGLLWFALAVEGADAAPDEGLAGLIDWIVAAGRATRWCGPPGLDPRPWLLGTTTHGQRHDIWRTIGRRLPDRLRPWHGAGVRDGVVRVASLLAG